jgi:hypothetical protein
MTSFIPVHRFLRSLPESDKDSIFRAIVDWNNQGWSKEGIIQNVAMVYGVTVPEEFFTDYILSEEKIEVKEKAKIINIRQGFPWFMKEV